MSVGATAAEDDATVAAATSVAVKSSGSSRRWQSRLTGSPNHSADRLSTRRRPLPTAGARGRLARKLAPVFLSSVLSVAVGGHVLLLI